MLKKVWEGMKSSPPGGEGKLVIVGFNEGRKAKAVLKKAKITVVQDKGDWNACRWYLRLDLPEKDPKASEKAKKTLEEAGIKIIHFSK